MTDYWINPKQEAVGVVAISDDDMSILYQLNEIGKERFRELMDSGVSLREAMLGPGEILALKDLTCVSLSPWSCCVHLEFVEKGNQGQHYLYLWNRDTFDKVVESLRQRLGHGWELKKGTAAPAQTWKNSWPIWALLLMFTVISFFAVRQFETDEAKTFEGRKGAAGRAFAEVVGRSIGSSGCLLSGFGLMALYAMWLIYQTTVPNQDQLLPVTEVNGGSPQNRSGPEG
jgi:hypothetical protein